MNYGGSEVLWCSAISEIQFIVLRYEFIAEHYGFRYENVNVFGVKMVLVRKYVWKRVGMLLDGCGNVFEGPNRRNKGSTPPL